MPLPPRSGPPRPTPAAQPRPNPGHATKAGPIHAVPCPHCGTKMDFRGLADGAMGGIGEGSIGFETGAVFGCDNTACRRKFRIAAVEQVTVVKVAPVLSAPAPAAQRRR